MSDRVFIDTNIFVYAYLENPNNDENLNKHKIAQDLLKGFTDDYEVIISTQVCNEYYSALLKNKIDDQVIQSSLGALTKNVDVAPVTIDTVSGAFAIKNRYRFSYWDSLVLSSALENGCTVIYSEDMQHNQLIDDSLKIINPFKISSRN